MRSDMGAGADPWLVAYFVCLVVAVGAALLVGEGVLAC